MLGVIELLAEAKIKEAIKAGDLDNLPGKGRPLQLEDLSRVPEDLRTGFKMMKNAGFLPEELQLKKEMVTLNELIACCDDGNELAELKRRLSEKMLRFNRLMEKRSVRRTRTFRNYRSKIFNRFHF